MPKRLAELRQQRQRLLAELSQCRDLVAGSFFARTVNGVPRLCLSRMLGRRQRQAYVAAPYREQVQRGVKQYRRALRVLRTLGEVNFQIIRHQEGRPHAQPP